MPPYANVDTSDPDDSHRVATLASLINIVVADLDAPPLSSGPIALRLLLLIAWHEGARLTQRVQQTNSGPGPARSFYQLQAATAATAYGSSYMTDDRLFTVAGLLNVTQDALMNDFLALGSGASFPARSLVEQGLRESDLFGSYLARIFLKTIPGSLPQPDGTYAREAEFWLDHWHTPTGDDDADNLLKAQFINDCQSIEPYLPALTAAYAASNDVRAAAVTLVRELLRAGGAQSSAASGYESLEVTIGSRQSEGLNIGIKVTGLNLGIVDQGNSEIRMAMQEIRSGAPMLSSSISAALLYARQMEKQTPPAPPPSRAEDPVRGTFGQPDAIALAGPTLESVASFWNDSCAGGDVYANNCAHFLSDAFIRAGFTELSGDVPCVHARCSTSAKRAIRARDMWCWFQAKATHTSSTLTRNTGWWAAFQLNESAYWGGHVVLFDSNSWTYYGTGWYPQWTQYLYQW